jgi:hypothetical protein
VFDVSFEKLADVGFPLGDDQIEQVVAIIGGFANGGTDLE